jgi:putative SOS response-associated peptidase YedK
MCNDYEQHVRWAEYCKMMREFELGIPTQQTELDLPEADDIKINDRGPVMRVAGNHVELASMNFSFPPSGRGGPVFNFRSENRRFDQSNRCIIPASAFYEFMWTLIDDAIWKARQCVLPGCERRLAIAMS